MDICVSLHWVSVAASDPLGEYEIWSLPEMMKHEGQHTRHPFYQHRITLILTWLSDFI